MKQRATRWHKSIYETSLLAGISVFLASAFSSPHAAAQNSATSAGRSSSPLEEIVVTAQKREQSIQDVGIAITAFTDEQLKTFGFTNSTEIAAFTPGVYVSSATGRNSSQFAIRGSVQNDFGDIPEGPNAVYIDEAYQLSSQSQMFSSFDMERVEVLKGPQGTLFGRNATGGLVSFLTKKPTKELEAYADVTYGRFDMLRLEGAVSGPLTDTLSGRLSVFRYQHNNVMNNTFTEADIPATPAFLAAQGRGPLSTNLDNADDYWLEDQWAVRGQLLFEPNEDVAFRLKADYAKSNPGSEPFQQVSTVAFVDDTDGNGVEDNVVNTVRAEKVLGPGSLCEQISVNTGNCVDSPLDLDFDGVRPNAQGDFFGHFEADGVEGRDYQSHFSTDDKDEIEIYSLSGRLTWDLGIGLLTSLSSYSNQERVLSLNPTVGPAPQLLFLKQSETEWFTQELRLEGELERFRWTAGAYFLTADTKAAQGLSDVIGGINLYGGLFFNGFLSDAFDYLETIGDATLDTRSYSLFGQVDYQLTERFTFTAGYRGILEEKDYSFTSRVYRSTIDERIESQLFAGRAPLTIPGTDVPFEFLVSPAFEDSTSDFLWSGKLQLDYAHSDNLLIYLSINRGIKAGSFNSPILTFLTQDQIPYGEEKLLAYEIGFKSTLLDGRATLNVSGYYYDYEDYQAFQFIGISGAIINADAEFQGLEAEFVFSPVDNLDLAVGLSLIDAEVKDIFVAPNLARDVEPSFTPDIKLNGLIRYTLPQDFFEGSLSLQLDGYHASSAFFNINNFDSHRMDGYWIGNARVRWISGDARWELGAFVENFTDERAQGSGFELTTICGCDEFSMVRPQWWGISVRHNL